MMASVVRPRRSVLYMPGSNARAQQKARELPADGVILDLEDATAPDAKDVARGVVVETVRQGGFGRREVVVRINGLGTPWGRADLEALAAAPPDAVLVPKVERPEEVRTVEAELERLRFPASTALWLMIETPLAVLGVRELGASSKRVACWVMGTSDLTKDLGARHTPMRLPMLTALGTTLLAARAYGLAALDGVHLALDDEPGLRLACEQGRDLGFDGKTLIHPKQIEVANQVFAPSAGEVEHARRVIEAHAEAERSGKGVVVLDGRLVENLHVAEARRVVALAESIGLAG